MSTATEAPPGVPVTTQQHSPLQGQAAVPISSSSVSGDSLTCQWANCGDRCTSAENLYDHVCERHVGRKSTNNLNLTCQWGNCRTTTVKRDHITSHIRVHVPLKPHKCDFCGKAFKRPQDLKKHVKTHADDSVLLRSPEPNRAQHGGAGGGYPNNSAKLVADLQSLAATASGYYPDTNMGSTAGYGYQNPPANASAYNHSAAPQGSAYGQVYYAVNQSSLNADYEMRKRAAFDALNEFFGDAKRRVIDPTTYYDVGHRLMALQSAPLPILGGYQGGGMSDYQPGPAMATHGPVPQHHQYSLPLPNLRTKNDLVNIDQFLEQLQTTVYENPSHAAAAGVAQPGSHYVPSGLSYRTSHSPPTMQHNAGTHVASSHAHAMASLTTPASTETPALTPASSVLSYTSGQSPNSVHSGHTITPVTRTSMGTMYPTLPSVSAMADMSGAYATTSSSSSAPPSGLATAFDSDGRRRYSGGLLQKAAQGPRTDPDKMDLSDDSTPSLKQEGSRAGSDDQHALQKDVDRLALASPNAGAVDPALRSPGQRSDGSAENNGKAPDEAWVENIRIIEALRQFVKERLEKGEYDEERAGTGREGDVDVDVKIDPKIAEAEKEARELYPVLRAVQDVE